MTPSWAPVEPRPFGEDDVHPLLRRLAALDGHTRSADDIETWVLATTTRGWSCAEVAAAMLRILSEFTGFIVTPGHVAAAVTEVRREVSRGWAAPPPPREFADDPAREIRWRRAALADYRARAVLAVAAGTDLREVSMIGPRFAGRPELPPAEPGGDAEAAARAEVAAFVRRSAEAMVVAPVALPHRVRPSVADPDGYRRAVRELEQRRAAPVPDVVVPDVGDGEVVDGEVVGEVAEDAAR